MNSIRMVAVFSNEIHEAIDMQAASACLKEISKLSKAGVGPAVSTLSDMPPGVLVFVPNGEDEIESARAAFGGKIKGGNFAYVETPSTVRLASGRRMVFEGPSCGLEVRDASTQEVVPHQQLLHRESGDLARLLYVSGDDAFYEFEDGSGQGQIKVGSFHDAFAIVPLEPLCAEVRAALQPLVTPGLTALGQAEDGRVWGQSGAQQIDTELFLTHREYEQMGPAIRTYLADMGSPFQRYCLPLERGVRSMQMSL